MTLGKALAQETERRLIDPFDADADAGPDEFETRKPFKELDRTCELVGKPKKKKGNLNPLQRRWFEANGWVWARVETTNAFGGVNVDLWHVFDYIAARADQSGILFVQVTTLANVAARRKKIRAAPETAVLLAAGNRIQIHAWSQPGGPGSKWIVRIEEIE